MKTPIVLLATTLLLAFTATAIANSIPGGSDSCEGTAPATTYCTTGTATAGVFNTVGCAIQTSYVGSVWSTITYTTPMSGAGSRSVVCERSAAGAVPYSYVVNTGADPQPGVLVTHKCYSYGYQTTTAGGAGQWTCVTQH